MGFIFLGLVPLCFLVYSVTHLSKLKINLRHPRVLVKAIIFLGFIVTGMYLIFK